MEAREYLHLEGLRLKVTPESKKITLIQDLQGIVFFLSYTSLIISTNMIFEQSSLYVTR